MHQQRLGVFLVLLCAALLAVAGDATQGNGLGTQDRDHGVERPGPKRAPTKARIEADLCLEVKLDGPKVIAAGDRPWASVMLVNDSRTTGHPVVKPGDGSDVGWREPFVYWTATIDRGDGKPIPVPKKRYGRCGLFDANWPKDAVALRPGEKLPLDIHSLLEFQQAGHVRLQAHYVYRDKHAPPNRTILEPLQRGLMVGVPGFEIVSKPVEFDVVRPLGIRVKVRMPLKVHAQTRLSDLLEITLVNQSKAPIACSSPTLHATGRLRLEIEGQFGGWPPHLTEQRSTYGIKRTLKPGESEPLLGPGDFANGVDGTWEYPVEDKVRLRASYSMSAGDGGMLIPLIWSDWVEVRVEK